jgi:phosphoribosylanthranilate isomerase
MPQPHPSTAAEDHLSRAWEIKICGVTSVADALAAVDAGADAIGLNFFASSPRYIGTAQAIEIAAAVGARAVKIGVLVDRPLPEAHELLDRIQLDAVQLHGDEPPEYLAELCQGAARSIAVIRAFRPVGSLARAEQYLAACSALGCLPGTILMDSAAPGHYGGSGQVADWHAIAARDGMLGKLRLILAGGLSPENVAEAIRVVRPHGVDVASGVEESPGRKSPQRMRAFVAAARKALGGEGLAP